MTPEWAPLQRGWDTLLQLSRLVFNAQPINTQKLQIFRVVSQPVSVREKTLLTPCMTFYLRGTLHNPTVKISEIPSIGSMGFVEHGRGGNLFVKVSVSSAENRDDHAPDPPQAHRQRAELS